MKPAVMLAAFAFTASIHAAPIPGQPAPEFRGTDVNGKPISLADFRGKTVVLEWNNPHCPFVQKHYTSGNMQTLQRQNTAAGVVWLTINSTAESHSEYMAPSKLAAWFGDNKAAPTAVLMDPRGEIGRAFGAKVTPHMYVIDPKGTLVYAGAIDDKRSANPADIKTSTNLVASALGELAANKPISKSSTTAYGCTIKY